MCPNPTKTIHGKNLLSFSTATLPLCEKVEHLLMEKSMVLQFMYDGVVPQVTVNFYDDAGKTITTTELESTKKDVFFALMYLPKKTFGMKISISGPHAASNAVHIRDISLSYDLVSGWGDIVDVSYSEDICEPMQPDDFWSLIPECPLDTGKRNIFENPTLAFYFDFGFIYELDFGFSAPDICDQRCMEIPAESGMLGREVTADFPFLIGADIPGKPILSAWYDYSTRYYPRRQQDFLGKYFFPAYIVSGDKRYLDRAEEILGFLKYSRWEKDGSNQFVQEHYPNDYTPHPEWFSGFDYLFDWEWLDGYGYCWSLHEPDHHVNSAIASMMVTGYQLTQNEDYLQMASDFLYYQMPRYGYHSGLWRNQRYFWTEYNPTGQSTGHTTNDATDNIMALAASAAATAAYYIKDEIFKKKLCSLSKGFLVYLLREYTFDQWFYYDGAENPLNPRRKVSHDMASMRFAFSALAYLYKVGVDVDDLIQEFSKIERRVNKNAEEFKNISAFRLYKLHDGNVRKGSTAKFTSFIFPKCDHIHNIVFSDILPPCADHEITLTISKVSPPGKGIKHFHAEDKIQCIVTTDALHHGIPLPECKRGEILCIEYSLTLRDDFDDTIKPLPCKVRAEISGEDYTITSDDAGIDGAQYTLPYHRKSQIHADNFLTFTANYLFPFDEEKETRFIP